jgi:hypothetical protein
MNVKKTTQHSLFVTIYIGDPPRNVGSMGCCRIEYPGASNEWQTPTLNLSGSLTERDWPLIRAAVDEAWNKLRQAVDAERAG